ncbi:hypothetical protein C8R47DRAFT_1273245 [Mycena vitilis]|nr:hypothetical protein C8R47DRAFT_1283020 [Mycena vitilis]KAJ6490262.1 hypothetical protein C8R47DRAFT_1273245 [Mycena vitilis]
MAFFTLFVALLLSGSITTTAAQDALEPQNGTTSHSGGLVSCTYDGLGGSLQPSPCSYFPDGKFYQGPNGSCPTSIAFFDFLCLSFDGIQDDSTINGSPDGSALWLSDNKDFVYEGVPTQECQWNFLGACQYSRIDGSFQQQWSATQVCPPTINPAQLNSTKFNCLSNDTAGWPLIGSSATVEQELACTYYNGDVHDSAYYCKYDTTGTLTATSEGTCPGLADAVKSTNKPSSSMCLETNNAGGILSSVSLTGPNGTMACLYNDNNSCTYFISNGTFNSGPSACPISIAPGSGPVGTGVPIGAIAEASPVAAAAAASPSPDKKKGLPQPVIIALLALNGALVIGVLGLGGFWVCRRHSGSTRSVDYTKVYASREGDYYDAPIEPYRPPSRIEK